MKTIPSRRYLVFILWLLRLVSASILMSVLARLGCSQRQISIIAHERGLVGLDLHC